MASVCPPADLQAHKDKAVTTLLLMNMQAVFPSTVEMPDVLLTVICDYAMPSCAQSRIDHLSTRQAQLEYAQKAVENGLDTADKLLVAAESAMTAPIVTVREALVRYAVETQVFRGHLLYVPLPSSSAARALVPKKDFCYRDKRDRLLAQQLFAALNKQRPDLPAGLNKCGPHIKLMVDGLHELYHSMLMRHVTDVTAWIKLLGLKLNCGAATPEAALALADKALCRLTRTQLHQTQTALRAIHGREAFLAAIVGPRNPSKLEVGMRVDSSVIKSRTDPQLEFNRIEQEIVTLDHQVKAWNGRRGMHGETKLAASILLKRCEAILGLAHDLQQLGVVASTELQFQRSEPDAFNVFGQCWIHMPPEASSKAVAGMGTERNVQGVRVALCPTCTHTFESYTSFKYINTGRRLLHKSKSTSEILHDQWDHLVQQTRLIPGLEYSYVYYQPGPIHTPTALASAVKPVQAELLSLANSLDERKQEAAKQLARLEALWHERNELVKS